jgi:hypothetical protein
MPSWSQHWVREAGPVFPSRHPANAGIHSHRLELAKAVSTRRANDEARSMGPGLRRDDILRLTASRSPVMPVPKPR